MAGRFHINDDVLYTLLRLNLSELANEQSKAFTVVLKRNSLPELDSVVVLCPGDMFEFSDICTDD